MCVGVPGKVVATWGEGVQRMATVEIGEISRTVCLAYVPEVVAGDYTIVHAGFAVSRLDEESARQTLELFDSLGVIATATGPSQR